MIGAVIGAVIVLSKPLSNFSGSHANYRVETHIVSRFASEGLDADRPFLQITCIAKQRLLNDVCEQHWVSLAVREQRVCDEASELFANQYRTRQGFSQDRFFVGLW